MKGKKVAPAIVAGSIAAIGAWVAGEFYGVKIPPEIAVAGSTVLSVLISIVTPNSLEADE
jgi:hypothetical protein